MTNAAQEAWISGAVGRAVDIDGVGGFQCVDVPKDYGQQIFGVDWRTLWPGAGNACDMINTYNPDYFDRIDNDPNNPGQIPERADIIIYAGTRTSAGDGVNPYGHIAVTLAADQGGVLVIDQDGFEQRAMATERLAYDNYGTGPCLGWLRPKVSTITAQALNVTPIQEEDVALTQDEIEAIARRCYQITWFGGDGLPLIPNDRLGRGEWPATLIGSNEKRIRDEILWPQISNAVVTLQAAIKSGSTPEVQAAFDALVQKLDGLSLTVKAN